MITDEKIVQIAKVCHETNRAYCETLGDQSQPTWEDAPDWQRSSAVQGVTYRLNNPDATPEDMHNNWMAEKRAAGWVYGDVKDVDNKTHPCMVEYTQLPQEQQVKDNLFSSVIKSILI